MLHNDELLEQIGSLERAKRFWRGLALGLAACLLLFLALGTGLALALYFHAQDQRFEAEAAMRDAIQREEMARQQVQKAAEAAEKAFKAAEKQKLDPPAP